MVGKLRRASLTAGNDAPPTASASDIQRDVQVSYAGNKGKKGKLLKGKLLWIDVKIYGEKLPSGSPAW